MDLSKTELVSHEEFELLRALAAGPARGTQIREALKVSRPRASRYLLDRLVLRGLARKFRKGERRDTSPQCHAEYLLTPAGVAALLAVLDFYNRRDESLRKVLSQRSESVIPQGRELVPAVRNERRTHTPSPAEWERLLNHAASPDLRLFLRAVRAGLKPVQIECLDADAWHSGGKVLRQKNGPWKGTSRPTPDQRAILDEAWTVHNAPRPHCGGPNPERRKMLGPDEARPLFVTERGRRWTVANRLNAFRRARSAAALPPSLVLEGRGCRPDPGELTPFLWVKRWRATNNCSKSEWRRIKRRCGGINHPISGAKKVALRLTRLPADWIVPPQQSATRRQNGSNVQPTR
jgi:DNA-binding MarR family transcriptional regulator